MSKDKLDERRQPQQKRAQQRRKQILDCSIEILKEEGLGRLNTAYISEKLDISVGSLYRYFPNKQSILHTLLEQWLEANRQALLAINDWPLESMTISEFVNDFLQLLAPIYSKDARLTLMLAVIMEVPELRYLEQEHDKFVIRMQFRFLERLGVGTTRSERIRISEMLLNQGHHGLMLILQQGRKMGGRTLDDLRALLLLLLERHQV